MTAPAPPRARGAFTGTSAGWRCQGSMPRVWPALLVLLVSLACGAGGCAMPVGDAEPESGDAPLRMELLRGEGDLVSGIRLVNDGVDELNFAPSDQGYSVWPRLYVQARQPDGRYEDQGEWYLADAYDRHETVALAPGGAVDFSVGYAPLDMAPGDYRVVVDLYDAGDGGRRVARELGRVGWPVETVEEAMDIRADAAALDCTGVVRALDQELSSRADPDGLDYMATRLTDSFELDRLRRVMLRRGAFADELARFFADAPWDDVDALLEDLARTGDQVQPTVKRAATRRVLDRVASLSAPLPEYALASLATMQTHWPEDGPEIIVGRIERGDDGGRSFARLLDVLLRAGDAFSTMRPRVYEALRGRCAGVTQFDARESCDRALRSYDPENSGFFGMGSGGFACACGGFSVLGGSRCDAVRARYDALLHDAPALEDYALQSRVEPLPADLADRRSP